jgi:hypothetical protein
MFPQTVLLGKGKFMRSLFLATFTLIVAGPGLSDCWAIERTDQTSIPLSKYLHQSRLPLVKARLIPKPRALYL